MEKCLTGYENIAYAEELAKLVFGSLIVLVPLWAMYATVRRRLDMQRQAYGGVNPWPAIFHGILHFFLAAMFLLLIYQLLALTGINAPVCAKQFWRQAASVEKR